MKNSWLILFQLGVVGLLSVAAQTYHGTQQTSKSVDAGEIRGNVYVNNELGIEIPFPKTMKVLFGDALSGASKQIADSLRTGAAINDKRLDLQENGSRVLLKLDSQTPTTFLSIAIGKDNGEELRDAAGSTLDLLVKTGQYRVEKPIENTKLSGQPIVSFTVKTETNNRISFLRIYALRRRGFQLTIGVVYVSDIGSLEMEDIVKGIKLGKTIAQAFLESV